MCGFSGWNWGEETGLTMIEKCVSEQNIKREISTYIILKMYCEGRAKQAGS